MESIPKLMIEPEKYVQGSPDAIVVTNSGGIMLDAKTIVGISDSSPQQKAAKDREFLAMINTMNAGCAIRNPVRKATTKRSSILSATERNRRNKKQKQARQARKHNR